MLGIGGVPLAWLGLLLQHVEGPGCETPPPVPCLHGHTPMNAWTSLHAPTHAHALARTPACTPSPAPTPLVLPGTPRRAAAGAAQPPPAVGPAAGHTDKRLGCHHAAPQLPRRGATSAALTKAKAEAAGRWSPSQQHPAGTLQSSNLSPAAATHPKGRDPVRSGARSIPGCGRQAAPALGEGIHTGRLLDLASIHPTNPWHGGLGPAARGDAVRDAGGSRTAGPDSQTPAGGRQRLSTGVISSL